MEQTAIIVIDMVNDFVTGTFSNPLAFNIIPSLQTLIDKAHHKEIPIIYCSDTHDINDNEFKAWPVHCIKGSHGAEIIPELSPQPNDYCINKQHFCAFFNTQLDSLLKELNISRLILTGVVTDICVLHTAATAFFKGYSIAIPLETTAAMTNDKKLKALQYMEETYQADIHSIQELIL